MMEEIISGLHTCKPGNTPNIGQIKPFLVTNETSLRTGNQWTKIRSASPDKGGRHYRIVSVRPTGTTDAHGNVSFNLELEEAPSPPQPNGQQTAPQTNVNATVAAPTSAAGSTPQSRVFDTVEAHVTRCANLYALIIEKVDTVVRDRMRARNIDLHEHPLWFQGICTTLWINAKDQGYIAHMSDREQKPPLAKQEPY